MLDRGHSSPERGYALRVLSTAAVSIVTASRLLVCSWYPAEAQTSPSPSSPWRAPDLRGYSKLLKPTETPPIDPQERYELVVLIDLAQRVNPETRVAWEAARRSASAVGLAQSDDGATRGLVALYRELVTAVCWLKAIESDIIGNEMLA